MMDACGRDGESMLCHHLTFSLKFRLSSFHHRPQTEDRRLMQEETKKKKKRKNKKEITTEKERDETLSSSSNPSEERNLRQTPTETTNCLSRGTTLSLCIGLSIYLPISTYTHILVRYTPSDHLFS